MSQYEDRFADKRASMNELDEGKLHDLLDFAEELLAEADGEVEQLEEQVSELEDDVRDAEEDAENSREEAKLIEATSIDLSGAEGGVHHGVRMSLEVALAHAQQTFGFNAKETHFIEDLISQL